MPRGSAPYPNLFRLSPFGNTIEAEPNDTHDTATPFTPPVALNGVIEKAGDVDSLHVPRQEGADIRYSRVRPSGSARRSTRS